VGFFTTVYVWVPHQLILDRNGKPVLCDQKIRGTNKGHEHDEQPRKFELGRAAISPQDHEDGRHFGPDGVGEDPIGPRPPCATNQGAFLMRGLANVRAPQLARAERTG
jgi:hypothetical protein